MINPAVTVVIPVYNSAESLRVAIDSILRQSINDFEVIVIDDGSDCSDAVVKQIPSDPRVRLLRHDRNAGYAAATNTALSYARGKWLTFVDADDAVHPDYVKAHLELGEQVGAQVVFGPIETSSRNGLRGTLAYKPGAETMDGISAIRRILGGAIVASQHLFLLKDAISAPAPVGNTYSDIVFICRNLIKVDTVAFLDRRLYYYAIHPGSVSGSLRESIWDLAALPSELNSSLFGHCSRKQRESLVNSARILVLSQMINKAALERKATSLRFSVEKWVRRATTLQSVISACRVGDWKAALSLGAVLVGIRFHRFSHRLYMLSKNIPR